jgi:hypothetical protein
VISLESCGSRDAEVVAEKVSSRVGEIWGWWLIGPEGPEKDGFLRMPKGELMLELWSIASHGRMI